MAFQPGDIVMLRSHGPKMTVHSVSTRAKLGAQTVQCEWFNQTGRIFEHKTANFAVHTLELVQSANVGQATTELTGEEE